MSKIDDLIAKRIKEKPERKQTYITENRKLQTSLFVAKLREEKGLSQRDLAALVGKPQSTIGRIESGKTSPTVETLSQIAEAVGKELILTVKE